MGERQRRTAPVLRLFVAAYPPPDIAQRLACLAAKVASQSPAWRHRPVASDQIHLTLLFLGPRPATDVPGITESMHHAASGITPFRLSGERLTSLPRGGRPRLIAVETDAPPGLIELQRRLATRLASPKPRRDRHGDGYTPHLTLARTIGSVSTPKIDNAIAHGGPPEQQSLTFEVDRIRLMRSTLTPTGAEHRLTAEVLLATTG